jgi:hypothetical protein
MGSVRRARPICAAETLEAALGRDDQILAVGVQRFRDQLLGHVGAIRVGGIDEVHPQLDRAVEDSNGLAPVRRWSPDTLAGEPHGAEAHPVHAEVAAQGDGARRRRGRLCGLSGVLHARLFEVR